jgi:hypothetical protein
MIRRAMYTVFGFSKSSPGLHQSIPGNPSSCSSHVFSTTEWQATQCGFPGNEGHRRTGHRRANEPAGQTSSTPTRDNDAEMPDILQSWASAIKVPSTCRCRYYCHPGAVFASTQRFLPTHLPTNRGICSLRCLMRRLPWWPLYKHVYLPNLRSSKLRPSVWLSANPSLVSCFV